MEMSKKQSLDVTDSVVQTSMIVIAVCHFLRFPERISEFVFFREVCHMTR